MDPKTIQKKYDDDTKPILARLNELREDDERAADGRGRLIPPAEADAERQDLLRRFDYADSAAAQAMREHLAESERRLAAARAQVGDDQARMADFMETDQLARSGIDAGALADQARQRLAIGDHRGALVRLNAAKLAANGKRVKGIDRLALDVEAALDEALPHRREAVEAHKADRFVFAEDMVRRTKTRQLMAILAGDRRQAARSSAAAKLRQYDLARAKGETYEQEVNLERVGAEPKITVSGG
ncbi:MAG TPA: hypothetical protein VFH63_05880 [candidate division Zixibacteria bacterium]|nr:hypothetical protein [candidate division Zixibacteria bacterium]